MKAQYFTSAKECIADFADNMGENTTVYLITFGKDVSCVLDGSNDAGEIKSVLSTLSNNQGGTKFFAAIKQAMDISDTCPMADMEYAVVFRTVRISKPEIPLKKKLKIKSESLQCRYMLCAPRPGGCLPQI